jgi:hypothetical protein
MEFSPRLRGNEQQNLFRAVNFVSIKPARQTAKFRKQLERIFLNALIRDDSQTKILDFLPSRCIYCHAKN